MNQWMLNYIYNDVKFPNSKHKFGSLTIETKKYVFDGFVISKCTGKQVKEV